MTDFEKILLQEVSALLPARRADVLAFARYLRISLMDDDEIERRYDAAIQEVHETAQHYNIAEKEVEEEIRAVRNIS